MPQGRRSLSAPLFAAGFTTAVGASGVAVVAGALHATLGMSLGFLAFFLALYDLAELVAKPLFGALSDKIGPKPVVIGGLLLFAAASAGGVFATTSVTWALVRLLQGLGAAAFSPASAVIVAHLAGPMARGSYFGRYGAWKSLGYAAGPLLAAAVIAMGAVNVLFAGLGVVALATAIFVSWTVARVAPVPKQRASLATFVRFVRRWSFVQPVIVLALCGAATGVFAGMLPALGSANGAAPWIVAMAVALQSTTSSVVQPVVGRAHDEGRISSQRAAIAGCLLIATGATVAGMLPAATGIVAAGVLVGVGVGVGTPVTFAALAARTSADRLGATMGAAELGREAGDAGGPLMVGAVSSLASLSFGFIVFGLLGAVVAVLSAVTGSAERAEGAHDPG